MKLLPTTKNAFEKGNAHKLHICQSRKIAFITIIIIYI